MFPAGADLKKQPEMDTILTRSLAGVSGHLLPIGRGEFQSTSPSIHLISSYHCAGSNNNNSTIKTPFLGERVLVSRNVNTTKALRRIWHGRVFVSVLKGENNNGSRGFQIPDDVESLKVALAAAEARADAAKKAEKQALEALTAMEGKSSDTVKTSRNMKQIKLKGGNDDADGISLAVQVEKNFRGCDSKSYCSHNGRCHVESGCC